MQTVNYLAALWGVAAIVAALYAAHCFRQDAERQRIAANRERRLVELLEAERRARLNVPAQVLDPHARIARLESERDDALAEARSAKGALGAARRERDHEARVAMSAVADATIYKARVRDLEDTFAAIRRTGYAGPGYAVVRLAKGKRP